MAYPVMPLGFLGSQGDQDTYRIERSLRFNSADSAYLNRTPASAGNRKTWTWSGWVKRGSLGSNRVIFSAGDSNTANTNWIGFVSDSLAFSVGDGSTAYIVSTALYRDTSAWYHIVGVYDSDNATSSNRMLLYVNGSQITSFSSTTYPTISSQGFINNNVIHGVGARQRNGFDYYFDGYLTEINFIDGQALTPSSFGETDGITGRWKAKAYSGTYGTNGFYLNFADNSGTTSTTLGKDSSPNGNNWTPNNFSVTAGAGNDSLVDSPTNYGTDTGVGGEVRGNYCTLNPIDRYDGGAIPTFSNGNLQWTTNTTTGVNVCYASMRIPKTGKWYIELTPTQVDIGNTRGYGLIGFENTSSFIWWSYTSPFYQIFSNGVYTTIPTISANDVIMAAIDMDAGKAWYGRNGTWLLSGNPSNGTNMSSPATFTAGIDFVRFYLDGRTGTNPNIIHCNFGQRPFAYTAPTGFKALCTTNLPQPTIQKPSSYMDVVTYTGTGSSRSITGLGFSPDLVWIKDRSAANWHNVLDTIRGGNARLSTNSTNAEDTGSAGGATPLISAFNSDGFTLPNGNDNTNKLSNTYVAWAWDEAPIAGMDIVSYTGTGTAGTVAHNLGVSPKMVIVKRRNTTADWCVYHASIGAANRLLLSQTNSSAADSTMWNSTEPTSSVFSVGTNVGVNGNNDTYIAYLFAEVEGFSKFGSYTGNGSADGPFVWCGFRPRWVMIKRTDSAGFNWRLQDTARGVYNQTENVLNPNLSDAEGTGAGDFDILSNGFKIRITGTGTNASGGTYIFAAFAESPFKYARAR